MIRSFLLGALLVLLQWPRLGHCAVSDAVTDPDLEARFGLARVPGMTFVVQPQDPARIGTYRAESLSIPDCKTRQAGLCDINWQSAPSRWISTGESNISLPADAQVMLRSGSGTPLLFVRKGVVTIAFAMGHKDHADAGFRLLQWSYFNYLLYVAACASTGVIPASFAQWEHSPLLGVRNPSLWMLLSALLWGICGLLFVLFRNPSPWSQSASSRWIDALRRSSDVPTENHDSQTTASWNEVGFARPLSGFLTLLGSMFLLIGPYYALQSYLAGSVQPFPEADGLWKNTGDTLFILWLTFDMGTQTAVVKYFAEHRVQKPQEALKDVQFYVFWQIAARTVEATLLIAVALRYLPLTSYALYAPFALLYALAQLPAITSVPKLVCQAMQRFDYQNLLDFSETRILSFVAPIPFILLGRKWGVDHPQYGEAFGAAMGMGIGGLFTQICVFALGIYAVKKLHIPILPMLLPQFDRDTVKRQLSFGFKVTMGQEPFRLTSFLESLIIIRWLSDFPVWLGIRDMIHNRLSFLFVFAWSYYQSALPVVSEANAQGKKVLIQYYIARYLQFGFLFSALVFSLLFAVGPRYVAVALGSQWQGAADYLLLGCLSGLLLPLAWLSDSLQQGAGKPGTTTVVMLIEQGLRLLLLIVFVPRLQFVGIYVALNVALILKCVIGWWLNHRHIVAHPFAGSPLRVMVWTPLLCGVVNFLFFRGLTMLIAPSSWLPMMALFFVAGAGSFVIGFFGIGLFGGLDSQALRELTQAAQMSAVVRPICQVLERAAHLGSRLSPWPATELPITKTALMEARELATNSSAKSTQSTDA